MDIARAHAVCEVAQTMIGLAKVEVDMVRVADGRGLEGAFFNIQEESRKLPASAGPAQISPPGPRAIAAVGDKS